MILLKFEIGPAIKDEIEELLLVGDILTINTTANSYLTFITHGFLYLLSYIVVQI